MHEAGEAELGQMMKALKEESLPGAQPSPVFIYSTSRSHWHAAAAKTISTRPGLAVLRAIVAPSEGQARDGGVAAQALSSSRNPACRASLLLSIHQWLTSTEVSQTPIRQGLEL